MVLEINKMLLICLVLDFLETNILFQCFIPWLQISTKKTKIYKHVLKIRLAILRTTEQILGLFVLTLMHFSC